MHSNFTSSSIMHACQSLTPFLLQLVQMVLITMKLSQTILACMIQHPISHILLLTCLIMQFHGNSMHACAYKLQIHHTQYHSCSWSDILFELTLLHTQIHELRVDHSPRSFNLHPFLLILECSFPIHNLESKCPMVLPLSLKVDSLSFL